MRIVRGKYKGKTIYPPKGFNSRPTTDFAKESLFNILENDFVLSEIKVLDLFSGSGNISLEFLSRGIKDIVSIEYNRKYADFIKQQFSLLFPETGKVINYDAYKYCKNMDLNYDLIFADPPFSDKRIVELPQIIFDNKSLKIDALIIIEHSAEISFKDYSNFKEHRKYGNVNFSFFKKV